MLAIRQIELSVILLLFLGAFGALSIIGQEEENRIECRTAPRLVRPEKTRMISFGVLNTKAVHLPKPTFPETARRARVSGVVQIQVVIDPRGCVNDAKAISGHPLLIPASIDAAKRSSFVPITFSGTPIWFYGYITYNFRGDSLNWLQLGFEADSARRLVEVIRIEDSRVLLNLTPESISLLYPDRTHFQELRQRVQVELAGDPKSRWLFSVGCKLGDISRFSYTGNDGLKSSISEISDLVDSAPESISRQLIVELKKLTGSGISDEFWKQLKYLKDRLYHLGS
ncbi:MAG: energy transducer TonB [Acidobacteria bacterium]|nr:energy transducer TonB [Acidobacteriota bacterium]